MRVTVSPEQIRIRVRGGEGRCGVRREPRPLGARGSRRSRWSRRCACGRRSCGAFAGFGGSVYPGGLLERRIKELVIVAASRRTSASSARSRLRPRGDRGDPRGAVGGGRGAGVAPTGAPRDGVHPGRHGRFEPHSGAVWTRLHEHQRSGAGRLAFLIGYINMLNLFNNLLEVRYHGDYRVLRPTTG